MLNSWDLLIQLSDTIGTVREMDKQANSQIIT